MTTQVQLVRISGDGATAFAHAQFSSHVDTLAIGQWQFSAWLDACGRVRAVFHLARPDANTLLLCLRGADAALLAGELKRFVFRAKVAISAEPPMTVSTTPAMPLHQLASNGGGWLLGCGHYGMRLDPVAAADDQWRLAQWRAGWPWLPTTLSATCLPQALSLERLGGVATDKGCYPGQEIMARLHFRGTASKRHLCSALLSRPVDTGPLLQVDGTEMGYALDVFTASGQWHALLVLPDAVFDALGDGRLDIQMKNLSVTPIVRWPA